MGKYMRPVLLLNRYIEIDEDTGEITKFSWRGSGRNATYSKLVNFREFLAESGLVEYAQGHASAFGVSILDDKLEEFKHYIDIKLKDFDFSNSYRVDFIWMANEVSQYRDDILELGKLSGYWGQGLAEPQIAIENI
jgi:single-stranded-DNA-specific exonuclease